MNLVSRPFKLKDYEKFDAENRRVLLFEGQDPEALLDGFYGTLREAIGNKRHLPVIRIADGEFQFLLGKNEINRRKPMLLLLRNILGELMRTLRRKKFEARSRTYTSGVYNNKERAHASSEYSKCLRHVGGHGVLALYTITKPDFYTEQYLPKFWTFLSDHEINLNEQNYVPFYFIYIVLTNEKYSELYHGMHLHLITSFDKSRMKKINTSLIARGASKITWTKLSRDKSLFDKIDVSAIPSTVDLIFVGGGIGKVNIFNQLQNMSVPIIDAGYVFETWETPELIYERDYCMPHNK